MTVTRLDDAGVAYETTAVRSRIRARHRQFDRRPFDSTRDDRRGRGRSASWRGAAASRPDSVIVAVPARRQNSNVAFQVSGELRMPRCAVAANGS
jgi:hypothetical protein